MTKYQSAVYFRDPRYLLVGWRMHYEPWRARYIAVLKRLVRTLMLAYPPDERYHARTEHHTTLDRCAQDRAEHPKQS